MVFLNGESGCGGTFDVSIGGRGSKQQSSRASKHHQASSEHYLQAHLSRGTFWVKRLRSQIGLTSFGVGWRLPALAQLVDQGNRSEQKSGIASRSRTQHRHSSGRHGCALHARQCWSVAARWYLVLWVASTADSVCLQSSLVDLLISCSYLLSGLLWHPFSTLWITFIIVSSTAVARPSSAGTYLTRPLLLASYL